MSFRKWYAGSKEVPPAQQVMSAVQPSFFTPMVPMGVQGKSWSELKQTAESMPMDAWSALQSVSQQQQGRDWIASPSSFKSLPRGVVPARGARTRFYDPLALMYATGYRDRRFSVSYNTLRLLTYQLAAVGAIINTRVQQVSSFAAPFRKNNQVGFQIKWEDPEYQPSEDDKKALQRVEGFVANTGWGENPYNVGPRPKFGPFLAMITRDSLTYDQANFEIIPDTERRPYEFMAVDASSIRLASTFDGHRGPGPQKLKAHQFTDKWIQTYGKQLVEEGLDPEEERIYTIQLIHGRIENVYSYNDLAFCIRNWRSDLWVNGYGFAEAEMCINMMLGMLWGEEYNRRFFKQGAAPKGILNVKGENISPEEMESFRRQWYAMIAGVENAWRTPVLQADDMQYQSLQNTNQEMQFQEWLNYQMRIVTAVYGIDPLEINFELGASGSSQGPLFENQHEWKLKHSRDKGLRPLLKKIAEWLNVYLIKPLDSRMYLDFVGLDELSEQDHIELLNTKTSFLQTFNESRAEVGLPPEPWGNVPNSPQVIQVMQMMQENGINPFTGVQDVQTAWETAGEEVQPDYGEAAPVPLYLQRRTLRVDEWKVPDERNVGQPGEGGGDGGQPGGPGVPGSPSGPQ